MQELKEKVASKGKARLHFLRMPSQYSKRQSALVAASLLVTVVGVTLLVRAATTGRISFMLDIQNAVLGGTANYYNGTIRFSGGQNLSGDFYPQSDCSGLPSGSYCFQRMGTGAGGYMSGIDIGIDDTIMMRSDAVVPYVLEKDSSGKDVWMPLVTKNSLPVNITADPNWMGKNNATAAIEVAAYNSAYGYVRTMERIYRADKSSGQWKLTDIGLNNSTLNANIYMDPNGQPDAPADKSYRLKSKYMVMSKTDNRIVYVTAYDGIWRTGDAGASWSKVYSWDPTTCRKLENACSSLIINDAEGKVYVFVKSTSGLMADRGKVLSASVTGGNLIASGLTVPDSVRNVTYDRVGTVYYTLDNGSLWKFKNNVQTQLTNPFGAEGVVGVAAHKDGKTLAVVGGGVHTYAKSSDGGATWPEKACCDVSGGALRSSDVPWMMSPNRVLSDWGGGEVDTSVLSQIAFQGNRLWVGEGVGAFYKDPATPVKDWIGHSRGIENMINQNIRAFKDTEGKSRIYTTMQDRGGMMRRWVNNISEIGSPAPSTYQPMYHLYDALRHGQGLGASPNGKYFITSNYSFQGHDRIICSSDSGNTLKPSANLDTPWKAIGSLSVNDSGKALFVPYKPQEFGGAYGVIDCNAATPTMTMKNFPSNISWTATDIGGYYLTKTLAAVDDNNVFYMAVVSGTGSGYNADQNAFNVYSSTDLTTWQLVGKAGPMNDSMFHGKIKAVSGKPGVIFAANGDAGGDGSVCGNASYVRSPASGSFKEIPGITEAHDFGFGLPATSGAFPQVYAVACYNNQFGIWTSTNFNPDTATGTWVRVDNDSLYTNPTAASVKPTVIDGDKVKVGCFYIATRDNGNYYACKK